MLNPADRPSQRLVFLAGADVLGRFEVGERQSVEIALPVAFTAGLDRIELTLVHPDAMRPADFQPTTDTRWLAICFHSAALVPGNAASVPLDLPIGIVAGNFSAMQLARILGALPSLRGKLKIQYVDTHPDLADTAHTRPENALTSAKFCWLQTSVGRGATTQALSHALPPDCITRRFAIPEMHAFWPFLSADPRAMRETNLYAPARYRFGDHVASGMTHYALADGLLCVIYDGLAEKEMPNLDALLAVDIMSWKRLDARSDVKLATYLQQALHADDGA